MEIARLGLVAVVGFMLGLVPAHPIEAQPPNASLASSFKAREVLAAGVEAAGGLAALQQLGDVTRRIHGLRTDVGQGAKPVSVEPTYLSVGPIPPTVNSFEQLSVRDHRKQRTLDHLEYVIFGGTPVEQRAVLGPSGGFRAYYDYIYHGIRVTPPPALAAARASAFRRYPEGLLLAAWSRIETARWLGEGQFEGRSQRLIGFADVDGTLVTMYFDAETRLLTKTEGVADDPINGDVAVEVVFQDYRKVGALVLPFRVIDRVGGVVLSDARVESTVLDTRPPDSIFARPDGFPEVENVSPTPTLEKLAPDVYAVIGADYNSLAIGFRDYIMVLEGGGTSRYTAAAIAAIKEALPDKPIRYLLTTHWNWDHVGGVRSYVAEGATIVTTPNARAVIERAVAATHVLRPDLLARRPRPATIEVVEGKKRIFTDGVHTVEIHDVSPSPHVDQMLIAYLPNERLLFEGDLLDINVPGMVGTAGHDTEDLARKIASLGLSIDRIVPVHGRPGTMSDLEQALARRTRRARASEPGRSNGESSSGTPRG